MSGHWIWLLSFFKLLHSVWLKRHVVPEGYFICVNIKGTTDDFDFRFYRFCCVSVSHDHNKIGIKVNAQHHSFWLPTFSMQQQTNEGVVARQVKAFNFWYGSNVRVLRKKGMSNRFHWFRFILRKSTACVCLCVFSSHFLQRRFFIYVCATWFSMKMRKNV